MLKKFKNQEEMIAVLFVGALVSLGLFIIFTRNLIDVGYMLLLIWYYSRFLKVCNNGGSR